MNTLVLGIIVGVILTLFCIFCLDAAARDARIADSELEAWREWLGKREGE